MPQIPVPATYRVVATLTRGAEQIVNVFHTSSSLGTEAEQAAVADAFQPFYAGDSGAAAPNRGIRGQLSDAVLIESISVQEIGEVPYNAPIVDDIGMFGTNAVDPLPLQTTMNIQWRTAVASRNSRGRTFLGGFTEGALVESSQTAGFGIWAPATMLIVADALADLRTRLAALNGIKLVVASLYDGVDPVTKKPIPRAAGVTFVVTSAKLTNKPGVQRRRANKVFATQAQIIGGW